ncbi:unnamed protein product [Thelazia callipaeda]|uniref:Cytochrome c oxidase subunit ApiCOX24 n=1 Tax=Thelazia callipaeda TaxID=103827 RepID=A0A0N5DBZ0_THECL|nr:unnamed protein product [Thelazia callipaeda]
MTARLRPLLISSLKRFACRRGLISVTTTKVPQNSLLRKYDLWQTSNVEGLIGYKERHYVWYSFEWIPLNTQILGFICLVVLYTIYGLNKVEIMSDRSWMGGNRAFVWYAIESRPGYEYAFVWKPIPEPEPSELMLMRTLQREMWEAALKRNTWFQAH